MATRAKWWLHVTHENRQSGRFKHVLGPFETLSTVQFLASEMVFDRLDADQSETDWYIESRYVSQFERQALCINRNTLEVVTIKMVAVRDPELPNE